MLLYTKRLQTPYRGFALGLLWGLLSPDSFTSRPRLEIPNTPLISTRPINLRQGVVL